MLRFAPQLCAYAKVALSHCTSATRYLRSTIHFERAQTLPLSESCLSTYRTLFADVAKNQQRIAFSSTRLGHKSHQPPRRPLRPNPHRKTISRTHQRARQPVLTGVIREPTARTTRTRIPLPQVFPLHCSCCRSINTRCSIPDFVQPSPFCLYVQRPASSQISTAV